MKHEEIHKALRRLFDKREVAEIKILSFNMEVSSRGSPPTLEIEYSLTLASGGRAKGSLTSSNMGLITAVQAENTKEKIKKQLKKKKEARESENFHEELKKL